MRKQNGGQYDGNITSEHHYIAFCYSKRPNIGVNFMVFGVKEFNDVVRFKTGRSENKTAASAMNI